MDLGQTTSAAPGRVPPAMVRRGFDCVTTTRHLLHATVTRQSLAMQLAGRG